MATRRRRLDTGRRTFDGRVIARLSPDPVPHELFRVTFGNGRSDSDVLACQWCGENPGRLYAYHNSLDEAVAYGDNPGAVYCGLHCWGQWSGHTDL